MAPNPKPIPPLSNAFLSIAARTFLSFSLSLSLISICMYIRMHILGVFHAYLTEIYAFFIVGAELRLRLLKTLCARQMAASSILCAYLLLWFLLALHFIYLFILFDGGFKI